MKISTILLSTCLLGFNASAVSAQNATTRVLRGSSLDQGEREELVEEQCGGLYSPCSDTSQCCTGFACMLGDRAEGYRGPNYHYCLYIEESEREELMEEQCGDFLSACSDTSQCCSGYACSASKHICLTCFQLRLFRRGAFCLSGLQCCSGDCSNHYCT